MTPWKKRVTALTQRMADDMKLRNYSQKTIDADTYHVGRFAEFFGKSAEQASPEDVRSFQRHLVEERKVGWSSFNLAPVRGLEFVWRWFLHILPKGVTKTRCYGGWTNHHRQRHVAECREHQSTIDSPATAGTLSSDVAFHVSDDVFSGRSRPTCGGDSELLERVHRTSWRDIFSGADCRAWHTFRERPG